MTSEYDTYHMEEDPIDYRLRALGVLLGGATSQTDERAHASAGIPPIL